LPAPPRLPADAAGVGRDDPWCALQAVRIIDLDDGSDLGPGADRLHEVRLQLEVDATADHADRATRKPALGVLHAGAVELDSESAGSETGDLVRRCTAVVGDGE